MDANKITVALLVIKDYCKNRGDDNCETCPFSIKGAWFDYCMFTGSTPHEGTTPDYWNLKALDHDKVNEEVNVHKFVKEHMSALYGSGSDIDVS